MSIVGELGIQDLYEEFSMSKYVNAAHRDADIFLVIKNLRAEVASLKEERDVLLRKIAAHMAMLKDMGEQYTSDGLKITDLTQQLSAAKEYAERLREALESVKQHADFKPDRHANSDHVELSGIQGGQLSCIADDVDIALALPKPREKV